MRRALLVAMIALLVSAFGFAGGQGEAEAEGEDQLRVVLYLNGTLGDKSFFDSAARGVELAEEQLGITARIIEGGYDPARWEPDIAQLAEGDWDIIIAGTWQLAEFVQTYAAQHPDKYWFTYDTSVDYSLPGLENVYSMLYSQNEGSFVVGALAAMITNSDLPHANDDPSVGFLGGMDIPVINDFLVGFQQGAEYVDSNVDVRVAYAGAFSDPAKGKELSLAMYDQGADVVFNVAGETGLGALDAAKERSRYAIGVDSDQYALFAESDPEKASYIVTSMLKNVDLSILRAIEMHLDGTLPYGEAEVLGIAEGGVGVADNENFEEVIPEEFRAELSEIEQMIADGEITVETAIGN
ncbi:MAG: BMP family lipoprotein [Alkalispirochaetaceae bacterium]